MNQRSCHAHVRLVVGVLMQLAASSVLAQSAALIGGGATLPASGYAGDTTNRLMIPGEGSMLAAFTSENGVAITYCQTGSGGGKNILAGTVSGFNVNAPCERTASPTGFGGTGLMQPHFVGSDAPLTVNDYSNYLAGHTASAAQPVQVPAVAGAVALVFNKPEIRFLRLSEEQVCKIFSGTITRWEDSRLASGITLFPVKGIALVPGPINMVYRSDGSGTSFSLTNHLSAKCGNDPLLHGNSVAPAFQASDDFSTGTRAYIAGYAMKTTASGTAELIQQVQGAVGTLGYAETASSVDLGVKRASIANDSAQTTFIDPVTFGADPLAVTLTWDKVMSPVNTREGRPQLVSASPAPLTSQCIAVVDPSSYAVPATGYPILAVSYLLASATDNGADAQHIKSLLLAPFSSSIRAATTRIGAGRGMAFLTAPAIDAGLVDRCINP